MSSKIQIAKHDTGIGIHNSKNVKPTFSSPQSVHVGVNLFIIKTYPLAAYGFVTFAYVDEKLVYMRELGIKSQFPLSSIK